MRCISLQRLLLWSLAISMVFMTGCVGKNAPDLTKDEVTLNIGYFSEEHFEKRYGSMLATKFPKLKYNIIPTKEFITGNVTIEQWSQEHKFDLIYLNTTNLQTFVNNNSLKELDTYIQRDSYPLDTLVTSVIELTKQYGNGKLYGLPPNFYSKALVYNKDVFDKNGLPYPTDQMTWEELIQLANKFEKGLSLLNPSEADWLMKIGQTLNLKAYDENKGSSTLDSPGWIKIFQLVQEPLRNRSITIDNVNKNPFMDGDYAMQIISDNELINLERNKELNLGLVTVPINPSDPQINPYIKAAGFFSISNSTPNADAAWELLQYFMSDKVAELEYRSVYGFSSLTSFVSIYQNISNMEAFYKLESQPAYDDDSHKELALIDNALKRVLYENIAIEDILSQ